MNDTAETKQAL